MTMRVPCIPFQGSNRSGRDVELARLWRRSGVARLAILGLAFLIGAQTLTAGERFQSSLLLGLGRTVRAPGPTISTGSLEYRYEFCPGRLSALACVEWNGGTRYASAGLFLKLFESDRLVLGIGSGPGYLNIGRFTLGNRLEFRSVAEIQLKLNNRCYMGLDYCHYSNGGTGSINPGAESVRMFLAIRLP